MSVGIISLLEKGRGPKELRSALGVQTRPLAALSRALTAIKDVGCHVPRDVLGGDLLGLLSHRMREMLVYGELSLVVAAGFSGHRARFGGQREFMQSPISTFPENAEPERSAAQGSGVLTTALPERHAFPVMLKSQNIPMPAHPLPSFAFPITGETPELWLPEESGKERGPWPPDPGEAATAKRGGEPVPSLLAEKLGEYWELHRLQQDSGKNLNQQNIPGGNSPAPGNFPSFWRHSAQIRRSWPEVTGQQIARRISSLGPEASSQRAVQTVNSGAPEKVEIQNIFHIDLGAESNSGEARADNLSERIADILREQALQHGIDIT